MVQSAVVFSEKGAPLSKPDEKDINCWKCTIS